MHTHEERKTLIQTALAEGKSLKEIGNLLGGVSRQRIYQLMDRYQIQTPEKRRKGYWKTQGNESQWLHRILCSRGIKGVEREKILKKFENNFPKVCPILGIPLQYGVPGQRNDTSASVDRILPDKGYTAENVEIISWRANRIKNNGTCQEFKQIFDYLSKYSFAKYN